MGSLSWLARQVFWRTGRRTRPLKLAHSNDFYEGIYLTQCEKSIRKIVLCKLYHFYSFLSFSKCKTPAAHFDLMMIIIVAPVWNLLRIDTLLTVWNKSSKMLKTYLFAAGCQVIFFFQFLTIDETCYIIATSDGTATWENNYITSPRSLNSTFINDCLLFFSIDEKCLIQLLLLMALSLSHEKTITHHQDLWNPTNQPSQSSKMYSFYFVFNNFDTLMMIESLKSYELCDYNNFLMSFAPIWKNHNRSQMFDL